MTKLAIDGGKKACPNALPSWPHYDDDEVEAVAAVLRSGKVNQWTGTEVTDFEKAYAAYCHKPFAIAVANGTLALELALITAGIGPGDEVIVTPRSYMASVSCVVTVGAVPVFADVDLVSQNMNADTISNVITSKTKAIIPVHLNGWPCDMPRIMALAKQHNLYVLEDCAQSHGATVNDKPVGSFGHAAAFSFCQDKIISTGGEGGMVLFAEEADWNRAWSYKDHGKDHNTIFHKTHRAGFRWLHESFGSNWRLSGIQATIGIRQLAKLDSWRVRRFEIFNALSECVNIFQGIRVEETGEGIGHACYRFCFSIDDEQLKSGWSRDRVMAAISAEGVYCLEPCPEIYKEKAFDTIEFPKPDCPNAKTLAKQVLLLQIHPMIDKKSLDVIKKTLEKVLTEASVRTG